MFSHKISENFSRAKVCKKERKGEPENLISDPRKKRKQRKVDSDAGDSDTESEMSGRVCKRMSDHEPV